MFRTMTPLGSRTRSYAHEDHFRSTADAIPCCRGHDLLDEGHGFWLDEEMGLIEFSRIYDELPGLLLVQP